MPEQFRIGIGGPFHRVERAAHIERLGRLVPLLIGITWVPLMLLTLTEWVVSRQSEPLIRDSSVHARMLVAVPLFVCGERVLDRLCGIAVARLFDEGYVPPSAVTRVRALLGRVAAWRDAVLPELILFAIALLSGIATLLGLSLPAGRIGGVTQSRLGVVRIWYGLVSLPLFQFFLWRSLYRWALWLRLLVGLSRVRLRLLPAHADRRAGIGFLKEPSVGYCAVLLLATSSVLCAAWATQIVLYGSLVGAFKSLFFEFVLLGFVIAFAPLLVFVPHLLRARIAGQQQYGGLVSDYTSRFQDYWIDRKDRSDLLGTSHIQSLNDLGTAYRENIERMQLLLFTPKDCVVLLVASFLPAFPLLFLQGAAHDVITRILRLALGRTPG
jgi:hypothetical protein